MRGQLKRCLFVVLLVLMTVISGCGGEDSKNTVAIFMMINGASPDGSFADTIENNLKDKLAEETKVTFNITPMYNIQKLMIEYAAGNNDIVILSKEDMHNFGENGSNMPLDDYFKAEDYPEGVFEGGVNWNVDDEIIQEEHLYGVPLSKLSMFQQAGFAPEDVFVTVSISADSFEQSIAAIKAMME